MKINLPASQNEHLGWQKAINFIDWDVFPLQILLLLANQVYFSQRESYEIFFIFVVCSYGEFATDQFGETASSVNILCSEHML